MLLYRIFATAVVGGLQLAAATGALYSLPVLNGPIHSTPQGLGSMSRIGEFIHPGLWHTHDNLERMKKGVEMGLEPWKSAFANFSVIKYSLSNVRKPL
jgi:hypothetical protein